ncbi:DUF4163 domain-containing protein [Myroides indicus]|uniref:Uncharacterized protein DUF4163 n=1 Tax=Myroides indicus TaxID=1323422 RepID=A0A4R7EWA7_9FLAO|nr:DUF4163 domain-containing protein [Myroides indicus]TDS58187.1 uncharacterized protein DUF4163 [Myroides indicus]
MKKTLYVCLSLLLLVGCKKKIAEPVSFEFELQEFHKKSDVNCFEGDCTEVNISIPVIVSPTSDIAQKINQNNLNVIHDIVSFDESHSNAKNYGEVVDSFINSYEKMTAEFPDENIPWKADVSGEITYSNDDLLTFAVEYYTFAGGAHGFKSEKAIHYNPKTGEIYRTEDLIKDWKGLQKIITKHLNPDDISIYDENNQLIYPESIFFYDNSIVALYNSFDVTAFVDGPIKVEMSKEEAAPFFKINLDLAE